MKFISFTNAIDFTVWDDLLHQYVDDQGRVNYATWKAKSIKPLNNWLTQAATVDLATASRDQQLTFWLNLYNALVIAQVLTHYPIDSIRPTVFGIPNWLSFFRFFQRRVYQLGTHPYSLNRIEHGTLRPEFQDPRIHFALVCAAIGCPLLRNEAYYPEQVHTQLDTDTVRFINNPAKVYYDSSSQVLYCSRIFQWYQKDFLTIAPSVPNYIQRYLSQSIPITDTTPVRYLPYDWHLNQRISS